MDWKLAIKEERAALKRIVALLFALADLAESACNHSRLVRRFVIWVLRRAETVAQDLVGEPQGPAVMPVGSARDSLADAVRLAQRFRDLAYELDRQARFAFAVHDNAEPVGVVRFGARQACDLYDFLKTMQRLASAPIARPAACGTGPPDTS
jgi:hypothetical protein